MGACEPQDGGVGCGPYNRGVLSGAGMMAWGCLRAFAKVNIGRNLMGQKGQLRLKEGKGLPEVT